MPFFDIEHGKVAYSADFVFYGLAIAGLTTFLVCSVSLDEWPLVAAEVAAGLVAWTALEYSLHRFVLHAIPPFKRWHEEHHDRPTALICAPTVLSASLIFGLVFLPALLLGLQNACAVTLGLLIGYVAYAVVHHANHHWRIDHPWMKKRKHWHALHHHESRGRVGRFGVTSQLWDRVLGG